MRIIFAPLLACFVLVLSGCGSLLSSMQVGSIDDPPNQRTLGRIIEDDNIETKAEVTFRPQMMPTTTRTSYWSVITAISFWPGKSVTRR